MLKTCTHLNLTRHTDTIHTHLEQNKMKYPQFKTILTNHHYILLPLFIYKLHDHFYLFSLSTFFFIHFYFQIYHSYKQREIDFYFELPKKFYTPPRECLLISKKPIYLMNKLKFLFLNNNKF